MEGEELEGRKHRATRKSQIAQPRRVATGWMSKSTRGNPPSKQTRTKSLGAMSPGPSRNTKTGGRLHNTAAPKRQSTEVSDDLTPPNWHHRNDTDLSSARWRSSASRPKPATGRTGHIIEGSASHRQQPEDEDSPEEDEDMEVDFDDDDMDTDHDVDIFEDDDEGDPREPIRIKLNRQGVPVGHHSPMVARELLKFARALDPTAKPGWHGQHRQAKKSLILRVESTFEFYGFSEELSEKWFNSKMSRCVSRVRYGIMKLIKQGHPRPADIGEVYWDKLVELRDDPAFQEKSEFMSSISLGRPGKSGSSWAQHATAIGSLVSSSKTDTSTLTQFSLYPAPQFSLYPASPVTHFCIFLVVILRF